MRSTRQLQHLLHHHLSRPIIPTTKILRRPAQVLPSASTFSQNKAQKRTKFTLALTREVPSSLSNALTSSNDSPSPAPPSSTLTPPSSPSSPISLITAQKQHESYLSTLRSILPTLTIPQDPSQPDCVFIEDTAVVIGHHAVINRMAAPSRRPEVDAVRKVLLQFGLTVDDMAEAGDATCDGGDVLYNSGRGDLFVGLSSRTNGAGVAFLRGAFTPSMGVRVIPVPLLDILQGEGPSFLHLKSIVTHIDDRTLLLPRGGLGDEIFRLMDAERRGYTSVRVPDVASCNVVSVNGVVLAAPTECPETKLILEREIVEKRGMGIIYEDSSEFAKCDGALTCKSILLSL